jgi:hypothetical protein
MGWYNESWNYRSKITSQNAKVDEDITNAPVMYDLSLLPAKWWTNVLNGGADIRVTQSDGVTECAIEVISCNIANSTGIIWFKSNSLLNASDVDYYIYCGNSTASAYAVTDTYGRNNVWGTDFAGAWHLDENPAGTAPQMKDSSGSGFDGTSNGSMTSGDSIAAKVGNGLDLDGADDYISTTCNTNLNNFTILCWFKSPSAPGTSAYNAILGQSNRGMYWDHSGGSAYYGSAECEIGGVWRNKTFGALSGNTWYQLAMVLSGTGVFTTYKNGVQSATTNHGANPTSNGGASFLIGNYSSGEQVLGVIDEVWYLNEAKTAAWINTMYNNQNSNSTFWATSSIVEGKIKTLNGLAKASVKTFNGLAIDSVKKINGIT